MPRATPADRVDRFAEGLRRAMEDAEFVQKMREFDMTPAFMKGPELEAEIERQYNAMRNLARANDLIPG